MKNTFFFKGEKLTEKDFQSEQSLLCKTQVIVCGSLAHTLLGSVNEGALELQEGIEYPAFVYSETIQLEKDLELKISSEITYREKRSKKKASTTSFFYEDECSSVKSIEMKASFSRFECVEADFHAEASTWVIFAPKDREELQMLLDKLGNKLTHSRFKAYFLLPPNNSHSCSWTLISCPKNFDKAHTFCVDDFKHYEAYGKQLENLVKKDAGIQVKQIHKEAVANLRLQAYSEFRKQLSAKAEEHFEQLPKGMCVTM